MKILLINKFLYPKGGDAVCTLTTGQILKKKGHEVIFWGMDHPENPPYSYAEFFVSNTDYNNNPGLKNSLQAALNILYSFEAKKKLKLLLAQFQPDVVHLNNFAHQISPSVLDAIHSFNIPIVMTMHDYKMVCPSYSMIAKGNVCEQCANGKYYHCAMNRCTKNSLPKSLINVWEMYLHHKIMHIYDKIECYISPSQFLMKKVKQMGLNGEVVWLPNCVNVDRFSPCFSWHGKSIVYVGRLSHEKGVEILIEAAKNLEICLKIIGDGPLKSKLEQKCHAENISNVKFLGYLNGNVLMDEIRKSMFLVIPSECYENNPLTIIESFALGKPVVGASIGGIPELVRDWETGLTFESGNVSDLKSKINLMIANQDQISKMGKKGRAYVEKKLNVEIYYSGLMKIYKMAIKKANK